MATASSSPLPPGDVLRMRNLSKHVLYNGTKIIRIRKTSPGGKGELEAVAMVHSIGTLETGTDSPVSIDSLTIASPERRTTSAGKVRVPRLGM
jgi:hypothetical protein